MNNLKVLMSILFALLISALAARESIKLKYIFTAPIEGQEYYYSVFLDSQEKSYIFLVRENQLVDNSIKLIPFQTIIVDFSRISTQKNSQHNSFFLENPYYYDTFFDLDILYETNSLWVNNNFLYFSND